MKTGLLIPLLLGSLGGCALVFDDEGIPEEPGEPSEPGPDPAPGDSPTSPPLSQQAQALLAEWSGCMSLANFERAEVASAWGQLTTADGARCTSCHVEASPSFPISTNAEAFFEAISEHKLMMLVFFTVDLASDPRKVILNTRPLGSVGSGAPPYAQHPRFTIEGAPLTALTAFYDLTVARKVARECDPSRLID